MAEVQAEPVEIAIDGQASISVGRLDARKAQIEIAGQPPLGDRR